MGWVMSFIYFHFIQIFLPNAAHYLYKSLFKYLAFIIMARSHRDQLWTRERAQRNPCPWRIPGTAAASQSEKASTPEGSEVKMWLLLQQIPSAGSQFASTNTFTQFPSNLAKGPCGSPDEELSSLQNPHGSNICIFKGLLCPHFSHPPALLCTPEVLGHPCHPEERGSTSPQ